MAHYAFLDETNTVVEVITGRDENEDVIDWEKYYGDFRGLKCKRTSYNTRNGVHQFGGTPYRGNYAGPGYKYDEELNAFIPPQPYGSWILNTTKYDWEAPVPKPNETNLWGWFEPNQEWIMIAE